METGVVATYDVMLSDNADATAVLLRSPGLQQDAQTQPERQRFTERL